MESDKMESSRIDPITINRQIELWRPITEYIISDIEPIYAISNYGKVYDHYNNEFVKEYINNSGYICVALSIKKFYT